MSPEGCSCSGGGTIEDAHVINELCVIVAKVHNASEVHYRTRVSSNSSFISITKDKFSIANEWSKMKGTILSNICW